MSLISKKEAKEKGIEHLVITEDDFQKYVQQPADEHEASAPAWLQKELALLEGEN